MQDIKAKLSGTIDIWVEHLADKLDTWRFIGVLLLEVHDKPKCAILERCISGTYDDGVPAMITSATILDAGGVRAYHVITLSATGDAETPAGGSVCIRCVRSRLAD